MRKKIGVKKCQNFSEKKNWTEKKLVWKNVQKLERKKIDVKKCQNFGEKKNWREKKLV